MGRWGKVRSSGSDSTEKGLGEKEIYGAGEEGLVKKDWDGKTVREEGENVCVGTGASGLQDLPDPQDPPFPTAAASATFSVSQGKRHSFKQVSSATSFYVHLHSSHILHSWSSFSGFSRRAVGTRSGIGCS